MGEPTEFVTCPTCKAEPGDPCLDGSEEVAAHADRLRHDEVEIRLTLSKTAAYRLARVVSAAKDESDPNLYCEFEDVEIALAQASAEVWCHVEHAKQ